MNETALRWKARIGKSRGGCAFVFILAVIMACVSGIMVSSALKNPGGEPQNVTIRQLVEGEVSSGTYVNVTGLAAYDGPTYWMEEDGVTKETYYFLVDLDTGDMVLVKHHSALIIATKQGMTTLTGMVRTLGGDIGDLVEEDIPVFRKDQLQTTAEIYIADGQSPPALITSAVVLAIGLGGMVLGAIPFFFPANVFVPQPIDPNAPKPPQRPKIKATGRFRKLKTLDPLTYDKPTQKFGNAIANLIPRGERELLVYIHHIVRTKTYGVTVSTTESDWGILINGENVQSVRAGKIYGWKDTWAVEIQYVDDKGKPQTLYMHLDDEGSMAVVVELLEQLRFRVETAPAMETTL